MSNVNTGSIYAIKVKETSKSCYNYWQSQYEWTNIKQTRKEVCLQLQPKNFDLKNIQILDCCNILNLLFNNIQSLLLLESEKLA